MGLQAGFLKILGFIGIPTSVIFPVLATQDRGLKVITLEGSGSLFEPIQSLIKDSETTVSVIPTGSAGGKESLEEGVSDFALTSLSNSRNGGYQEARLADDPISLIYKNETKCDALKSNGNQNGDLLDKLFQKNNGCKELVFFVREGGHERSNLNKTVFKEDRKDQIDKDIQVIEIPENNFLAFEKFSQNGNLDAVIFLPSSFYEQNKDWLQGYKEIKLKGTQSTNNSPKLQKELNLVFKKEKVNEENNGLKNLFTKLLLNTKDLKVSFKLSPQNYCSNETNEPKCNGDTAGSPKDIKTILNGASK